MRTQVRLDLDRNQVGLGLDHLAPLDSALIGGADWRWPAVERGGGG